MAAPGASPARVESSTRVSPRARSESIMGPSAATVPDRSPPPSCSRTTLPRVRVSSTLRRMASAPGSVQSWESTWRPAVTYPRSVAMPTGTSSSAVVGSASPKYGGRKKRERRLSTASSSRSVASSSSRVTNAGVRARLGWVKVWLPTSCPSATICRSRGMCRSALAPITKKVAGAPRLRSVSRIIGVQVPSGPSSNVRATLWPDAPYRRTTQGEGSVVRRSSVTSPVPASSRTSRFPSAGRAAMRSSSPVPSICTSYPAGMFRMAADGSGAASRPSTPQTAGSSDPSRQTAWPATLRAVPARRWL